MLQAHPFLWHYLWLAPETLQLVLAGILIRRGLHRIFPIFLVYLLYEAAEEFTLYVMDLLPSVTWETYWHTFFVALIIKGFLRLLVIGELFTQLVCSWPVIAKFGNHLIRAAGIALMLLAAFAAAYAPIDNPRHAIISREHILEQTLYIILCGLVLFLFLFAGYFRVSWERHTFGILLGFAILFSERMAAWGVAANGLLFQNRQVLDYLNMATYHVCVLIWFYYLLVPGKKPTMSAVPLPEHNLAVWNRELERLLQQ